MKKAPAFLWRESRGFVIFRITRVYPEFCVNVLRECKQQKLV